MNTDQTKENFYNFKLKAYNKSPILEIYMVGNSDTVNAEIIAPLQDLIDIKFFLKWYIVYRVFKVFFCL